MFGKYAVVSAAMLALALAGCGESGPEIATVEGTVTMDGKPLPNASVMFTPENGRPAAASTDKNGYYILKFSQDRTGAIPGPNKVSIFTYSGATVLADGTAQPARDETVPARYNDRTELERTVEPDKKNVFDFELTSDGEMATRSTET